MRAMPRPDVHVDERPESSATWRTYHVRKYSSAAAACSRVGRTGSPFTVTRSNSGTLRSPCSPIAHASTLPGGTPSARASPVRSRRLSLIV